MDVLPDCVEGLSLDPVPDGSLMKTLTLIAAALSLTWATSAQAADDDGIQFFEQKIRPVLVQHCYGCHSVAARDAKQLPGELYLDTAAGVAKGAKRGRRLSKVSQRRACC